MSRSAHLGAWAVAVTVAGFCIASMLMLYDMRLDTRGRAVTAEANLLNALSQDIARNVELYDLSLRAVVDGLAEPGFGALSPRMQDLMLYDRAATATDLGAILVLDAAGRETRGSNGEPAGVDFSDLEFFRALKAEPSQGLFISRPFVCRLTGDDVIALARALRSPDGSFAGVVVGTLRLDYLRKLFAEADLGPHGAINLFLSDGTRIMRQPFDRASVGASLAGMAIFARLSSTPSGTFDADSTVDGVRRIYTFGRIGRLPLILDVALSEDDVFAPWRDKAAVIGSALLFLCAVAAVLARMGARKEAEHRLLAENAIDVVIRLDRARRRTYVSASSQAVLGYAPSELIGGSPRETVLPDDWPIAAAWLDRVQGGSAVSEAVFRVRRKDGAVLWIEGRCRALPGRAGYMTVLRDVSGQRAAEERAAALTAKLASLANSDSLTGLSNRRRLDAALEEAARAASHAHPLSFLLIDVDRFKAFNDHYGHQEGDACLRAVAGAVRGAVDRPGALVARYGGEEIAVVLPDTDCTSAMGQAERVRAAVEQLAWPHADNEGGILTVSVGCASTDSLPTILDQGDLVAMADARLYEAKRLGRNRVAGVRSVPQQPVRLAS